MRRGERSVWSPAEASARGRPCARAGGRERRPCPASSGASSPCARPASSFDGPSFRPSPYGAWRCRVVGQPVAPLRRAPRAFGRCSSEYLRLWSHETAVQPPLLRPGPAARYDGGVSQLLDAIAGVPNASEPVTGLIAGGQPQATHLAALKRAGCELVLDCRDPMEP